MRKFRVFQASDRGQGETRKSILATHNCRPLFAAERRQVHTPAEKGSVITHWRLLPAQAVPSPVKQGSCDPLERAEPGGIVVVRFKSAPIAIERMIAGILSEHRSDARAAHSELQ